MALNGAPRGARSSGTRCRSHASAGPRHLLVHVPDPEAEAGDPGTGDSAHEVRAPLRGGQRRPHAADQLTTSQVRRGVGQLRGLRPPHPVVQAVLLRHRDSQPQGRRGQQVAQGGPSALRPAARVSRSPAAGSSTCRAYRPGLADPARALCQPPTPEVVHSGSVASLSEDLAQAVPARDGESNNTREDPHGAVPNHRPRGPRAAARVQPLVVVRLRLCLHLADRRAVRHLRPGAISAAGPSFWWGFLLVFGGQLLVALHFAMLVSRWPIEGSIYQWSRRLLGTVVRLVRRVGVHVDAGHRHGDGRARCGRVHRQRRRDRGPDRDASARSSPSSSCSLGTAVNLVGRQALKIFMSASIIAEVIGSLGLGTWLLLFHRHNRPRRPDPGRRPRARARATCPSAARSCSRSPSSAGPSSASRAPERSPRRCTSRARTCPSR